MKNETNNTSQIGEDIQKELEVARKKAVRKQNII